MAVPVADLWYLEKGIADKRTQCGVERVSDSKHIFPNSDPSGAQM